MNTDKMKFHGRVLRDLLASPLDLNTQEKRALQAVSDLLDPTPLTITQCIDDTLNRYMYVYVGTTPEALQSLVALLRENGHISGE